MSVSQIYYKHYSCTVGIYTITTEMAHTFSLGVSAILVEIFGSAELCTYTAIVIKGIYNKD